MEIKHLELGFVNAFLIKTPAGPFLVDCGMAFSRAKLEQQLSMYGIAPADIKLLIVTHADIDHIGNCAYLQKQHGVKIAVHQGDADMCRTGKTDMDRQRKASWLSKLMRPLVVALLYKPMMKKFPLEPFEPDIILDDGHNFTDIGLDAVAIHIPECHTAHRTLAHAHAAGVGELCHTVGPVGKGSRTIIQVNPCFAEKITDNQVEVVIAIDIPNRHTKG